MDIMKCPACRDATMCLWWCGACQRLAARCVAHHAKVCGVSGAEEERDKLPPIVMAPTKEGKWGEEVFLLHFLGGHSAPPGTTGPDGDPDAYARRDPD